MSISTVIKQDTVDFISKRNCLCTKCKSIPFQTFSPPYQQYILLSLFLRVSSFSSLEQRQFPDKRVTQIVKALFSILFYPLDVDRLPIIQRPKNKGSCYCFHTRSIWYQEVLI